MPDKGIRFTRAEAIGDCLLPGTHIRRQLQPTTGTANALNH